MQFIGPSIKVSPKRKVKEWRQLQYAIAAFRRELFQQQHKRVVVEKHQVEKEVQKLKARPLNKERSKLIRAYEEELGITPNKRVYPTHKS